MPSRHLTIAAVVVLLAAGMGSRAQAPHPIDFAKVDWQTATVEDMAFLDAYTGEFRSETYTASGTGKTYYFAVRYEWYNTARTVMKWTIDLHVPADNTVRRNGEGFYAYDPFERRILVTGFFPNRPVTSKGWISDFDTDTGERVVRMMAMTPGGQVTQVRDTFRLIDEDTWENATFISVDGGQWQALPPDVYTRIEAEQP